MRILLSMWVLLACMLFCGCSKDADFVPVYNVPAEYQHFIEAFIREAADRGYSIKIDNLIIEYDAALQAPHCAKCNSRSMEEDVQKIISINPNLLCWFTDEQHEALIFHELGHCVLGRLHDDGILPNGDFRSLMNANDIAVYSSCLYAVDNEPCDETFKRSYYLDELFDEETPVPDWGF